MGGLVSEDLKKIRVRPKTSQSCAMEPVTSLLRWDRDHASRGDSVQLEIRQQRLSRDQNSVTNESCKQP